MTRILGLIVLVALAGCSNSGLFAPRDPAPAPAAPAPETPSEIQTDVPGAEAPPPPPSARTPEDFDTTSASDREEAAAVEPVATEERLGTTIASLGDPTDPGFWAQTPLVTEVRQGRLEFPETGKSVAVELRPSGGAPGSGTSVSLPALRVLEAPLTALPEIVVFGV